MRTVSKGKLKAKMLEYFREVESSGESLIVTDRGKEVLEVRAIRKPTAVHEILEEYRAGSGRGIGKTPEEVMLEPIPESEWTSLGEENTDAY